MQVCPTVTPGPPPVGIREYLRKATQQVAVSVKASLDSYNVIPEMSGGSKLLYHNPSFGLSTGSRIGIHSIAIG